jgi:hypothetical protein
MSIEAALAELTAALQENTKTSLAVLAALNVTASNQERLIAGQGAAIDKVEAGKATPAPRTRKKATEEPAVMETGADVAEPVSEPEAKKPAARVITEDDLRTLAGEWLSAQTDPAKRKEVGEFCKDVAENFGKKKLVGPVVEGKEHLGAGIDDPEELKQAWFFISRKQAGLPVDFKADYDFDGAIDQGAAPAAADDEFDIG